MERASNSDEPTSDEERCSINLIPSEIFLKFRKEIQGFRVGVNLELYNSPLNDYHAKLVLKPLAHQQRWKLFYEPIYQDFQLVSKKITVTKFLNLQVGVGHSFQMHTTGWKWKLSSTFGANGISRIANKTSMGVCPGVDLRFGWRADLVLPEVTGGVGTDRSLFNMNSGRLEASLDRIEAIFTHPVGIPASDVVPLDSSKAVSSTVDEQM